MKLNTFLSPFDIKFENTNGLHIHTNQLFKNEAETELRKSISFLFQIFFLYF